ncbi:MAG TPA: hypothetical protein VGD27_02960 [Longimicrobiales bacterium]
MRRVLGAAILVALAGCASNTQVSQVPPAAGTYNLIAVDGQAVPHVLASGEEVISGQLLLKADESFEMRTAMKAQVSSLEPLSFQREQSGVYTTSPIGVQLAWRTGGESIGAFFGRTLRLYYNGVEYLYMK